MADRKPIVINSNGNLSEIDTSTDNLGVKLEHLSDVLSSPSPAAHSRLVHNGTNWKSTPGGGICCYRENAMTLTSADTWYPIEWDSELIKWGNLTHSTSTNSDEITLSTTGVLKISASASCAYTTGAIANFHLKIQYYTGSVWNDIFGSECVQFVRNTTGVQGNVAVTVIFDFGSNTKFRVVVKRISGTVDIPAYNCCVAAEYVNKS